MSKKSEIVLTINEHKAAAAIISEAKNLKTAYGSLGAAVRAFVGEGDMTFDQMQARGKLFRASPEYKAAAADIQAACRKAFQRMMDAAFPSRERKARGARPEGNKKAAEVKEKIVKKIEHVLPEWAKDMPPLLAAWCEDHPIQALAALRAAYDRDVANVKRAA